jgi:hypothetical protein
MKKRTTKKQALKPQIPEAVDPKKTEADSNQGKTTDVPFDGRTMAKTYRFKGGQTFSFGRED